MLLLNNCTRKGYPLYISIQCQVESRPINMIGARGATATATATAASPRPRFYILLAAVSNSDSTFSPFRINMSLRTENKSDFPCKISFLDTTSSLAFVYYQVITHYYDVSTCHIYMIFLLICTLTALHMFASHLVIKYR